MTPEQRTHLRQEIMICCKANQVPVTAELYLRLIFCSNEALVKVAQALNIRLPQQPNPAQ